jgi:glycerol kinase
MATKPGIVLAIDQGTTGTTVVVLDADMSVLGRSNHEFAQIYPKPGWVEHDPEDIWESVRLSTIDALKEARLQGSDVSAIGITNQRETTLIWDRQTHQCIHNAIVWQCRRTTDHCAELRKAGLSDLVRRKTGLVIDPYFSGTKASWILDHVEGARDRAEAGELAFGNVDTYLLWRLTAGTVHATEVSNASRTMLMELTTTAWDPELLGALNVPEGILPEIRSSSEVYGVTRGLNFLPDGIPIAGMAGDQQAALFGQACFDVGQAKCTYGTGAFLLMNTGRQPAESKNGLLTTVAWRLGDQPTYYALEGSVFIAGAAVQWLRDELQAIQEASEIEALARSVTDAGGVTVVSAFTGLGAPYWNAEARGAIFGLTRGSNRGHIARAILDGLAHQVTDVVEAMATDAGHALQGLRVDGGAAANDLLMEIQADLLGTEVRRPWMLETTALGAAFLAGLAVGIWSDPAEVAQRWREQGRFVPSIDQEERDALRRDWKTAIQRLL